MSREDFDRVQQFFDASERQTVKDGDRRMGSRQSDSFIVLLKLGNASGGKGAT